MTEEEKIQYEEKKLLLEEEMKKKKEDLLVQFLKDKMAKEEKFTKMNMLIINDRWRAIRRDVKSKELKAEITVLKNTFDRVIDQKDEVIKALLMDIEEAEEQYMIALRSHLQNIEQFLEMQKERLATLKVEYNKELKIIEHEFELERKQMLDKHNADINELADILFAMEQNFIERENDAKLNFQGQKDEVRNKNLEEKHSLRVALESKVDHLWHLFNQAKSNYHETTAERKEAFEKLKSKDAKSSEEIDKQMRKVQRLTEQITSMKGKIVLNMRENEEKNKILREEKEKMTSVLQVMKNEMNKLRILEHEKLTKLTLESSAAIKELKRQKAKCACMLELFERCRKFETEEEKILPFCVNSLTAEEKEELLRNDMEPPTEPLANLMMEYRPLENFWQRYNKVMLDKVVLQKEESILSQENQKLRFLLKQYLDGISVTSEVMSEVNPLLIIQSTANAKLNIEITDPRVKKHASTGTKLEAALIVKNILR